jgi:type II secretory pathway component PulJ
MNWDALGAIAELLGAIAVFATLAYLAVQIRQSNIVTREQAQYHMLQNQLSYFDRLAESADFVRTVYGIEQSEDEIRYRQHEAHIVGLLFRWNWEYLRVQDGIYPVDALPVEGFRWQYRTIGISGQWEEKKSWLDPGFVDFMEKEIIPYAKDA